MLDWVTGEDQDVVKVDENKPMQEVAEDVVNEGLENGGGVSEAKRHHQIFVVA